MLNRVFGNRYRLTECIGIGGMAEVYKATDETLGRTVAVKVMLKQYAADPTFAARFKQEAQAAANLQSPYIVNIYDWGHDDADNTYFIVMEYVRGTDLKTAINQRGAINQRKAAEVASQVCSALTVAHGYDIIHRDIKPHNIMVQPDGNAKVMDFGIARANGSSMTQTGSVLGTAYYVSPEQAQGKPLTSATDLYSLGVVLYEAVTGHVPFEGPDAVSVALKQVNEKPVPPSELKPDLDPALEAIIMRTLSKNPLERYSTADQMRTALNNYLAGRPIDSGVVDPTARTRVLDRSSRDGAVLGAGSGGNGAGRQAPPVQTAVMPSVRSNEVPLTVRSSSRADKEKERSRRSAIIIAVVAAILVIAVGGIIAFFLLNGGGSADEMVTVPDLKNATEIEARGKLADNELEFVLGTSEYNDEIEKGRVIRTDPAANQEVKKGAKVTVILSNGPEMVEVPELVNTTPEDARSALDKRGLVYIEGTPKNDPNVEKGRVCAQDVKAGESVKKGTTITVNLSLGKEMASVPQVVGLTAEDAERYLTEAGLEFMYADSQYSSQAAGTVISQDPTSGIEIAKGSTITLTLSAGPEPVTVPDLTGKTLAQATTELRGLGLFINSQELETNVVSELGHVVGQDPASGDSVAVGSTVTVYIGKAPATPSTP
ncbi:MAG: Stk1 family PASTA domain-containing Ser/Thr kinase [Coriobacteriales bacterium]|nr:Stk1 family PASTA domain-containing Ser/Thr kinase [Coriobacteriales bacterium]